MATVIAVDGPSGAGKGTVSQALAQRFGFHWLDSGSLYRLTGLAAQRQQVALDDAEAVAEIAATLPATFETHAAGEAHIYLAGDLVTDVIRTEIVGSLASQVAAMPAVREALLQRQRDYAQAPGLVADGRDMGTVVFPEAPLKVFLTASAEERANRRYLQLKSKGESVSLPALLADIQLRDERDRNRSTAPLVAADDALVIDSTQLSIEDVLDQVVKLAISRNLGI